MAALKGTWHEAGSELAIENSGLNKISINKAVTKTHIDRCNRF